MWEFLQKQALERGNTPVGLLQTVDGYQHFQHFAVENYTRRKRRVWKVVEESVTEAILPEEARDGTHRGTRRL
jgi:hypothetical protein